jgi:hypothetical protein
MGNFHKKTILMWATIFIFLCPFFWIASGYLSEIVDDAFISFRYAKHLAEGKGLVFNEGERVEGYTDFLWVLLMAAGHKVGFEIPWLSQTISVLCAALLVVAVAVFSKSYFRDMPFPYLSYLAPIVLVLNPLYLEHIGTGLETLLFALLMFLSVAAYLNHPLRSHLPYLTGILLGLGYLTRPEAVIWACSFVALDLSWAMLRKENLSERMPEIAKYAGVFAFIVVLHLVWRVSYYGDWLPNTYYAKGTVNWSWGIYYTRHYLFSAGFIPLIAMFAGPFLLKRKWTLCISVLIAGTLLYNVMVGGDFIFTGRFLYPLLPLIYIVTQEIMRLSIMATMEPTNISRHKRILWSAVRVAVLVLFLFGAARSWVFARIGVEISRGVNENEMRLTEWIAQNTRSTDRIAVIAAGVLPYYSENKVIDMGGLTDRHIARYGATDKRCTIGHQRADSDYVLDRIPEVILVLPPAPALRRLSRPLNLQIAANQDMLENPRFGNLYDEIDVDPIIYPYRIFIPKGRS